MFISAIQKLIFSHFSVRIL